MTSEENTGIPRQSKGDMLHATMKAALSVVPGVGGPAVELFQYLVQPPLEKRREEWMRDVGERLSALSDAQRVDIDKLQSNAQFVSVVLQATQSAMKTHLQEKKAALRNAVLNVATGLAPDETIQHLLLNFIDELSPMHLRILRIFHAPSVPPGMSMGGLLHVLEYNIAELRGHEELTRQLWRDLYARGLLNTEGLGTTMSGNGLAQRRTTGLGEQLLRFIEEQPD